MFSTIIDIPREIVFSARSSRNHAATQYAFRSRLKVRGSRDASCAAVRGRINISREITKFLPNSRTITDITRNTFHIPAYATPVHRIPRPTIVFRSPVSVYSRGTVSYAARAIIQSFCPYKTIVSKTRIANTLITAAHTLFRRFHNFPKV